MNLRSLSVRDRRALLLGGAAFAPMLLWLLIVAPFTRHLSATRDRLERSGEMLRRELSVVRSASQYAAARTEVQRRLAESQQRLIYATSDASARTMLVGFVDERARASDIDVAALDATGDSTAVGTLRRVSVRLSGTGDMEGVLTLIGALEGGSPFLVVSQIEIEARGVGQSSLTEPTPVPASTAGGASEAPPLAIKGPEALTFRLVVTGFRTSADPQGRTIVGSNRVAAR
jgi:type II secretory pathway component PulM